MGPYGSGFFQLLARKLAAVVLPLLGQPAKIQWGLLLTSIMAVIPKTVTDADRLAGVQTDRWDAHAERSGDGGFF
jgi:hypothetical protein